MHPQGASSFGVTVGLRRSSRGTDTRAWFGSELTGGDFVRFRAFQPEYARRPERPAREAADRPAPSDQITPAVDRQRRPGRPARSDSLRYARDVPAFPRWRRPADRAAIRRSGHRAAAAASASATWSSGRWSWWPGSDARCGWPSWNGRRPRPVDG